MKSRRWWFHFPGEVYANHFDFEEPVSEAEARDCARHWLRKGRLPNGTEVWAGGA